jgi:hypothetical protein
MTCSPVTDYRPSENQPLGDDGGSNAPNLTQSRSFWAKGSIL